MSSVIRTVGTERVHLLGDEPGTAACGARLGRETEMLPKRTRLTCPRCNAIQTDRKRRRERDEHGGGAFDPFAQIKLTRNARGVPQWEITVPFGATAQELREVHRLAVDEFVELEREFGRIEPGAA